MDELPQNLKVMLQEIGERTALLHLHLLIADEGLEGWRAYSNHVEHGRDIVLIGPGRQLNLEVKTRQTLLVKSRPNQVQFTVSELERNSCEFLLAYWFNRSTFFIVPTDELRATTSNGKVLYKFSAGFSEENLDFTDSCRRYAGDWLRITEWVLYGKF